MEQLQELKLGSDVYDADDPEAKTPAVYFNVFWNLEKLEKLEMLNTDLRVMQYRNLSSKLRDYASFQHPTGTPRQQHAEACEAGSRYAASLAQEITTSATTVQRSS